MTDPGFANVIKHKYMSSFVELPVPVWNGHRHVPIEQMFPIADIKRMVPNGNTDQTKLLFKDGTEEIIALRYSEASARLRQK